MDRDGQFDHAEPGAEMAAGGAHGRNRLGAQLVGELAEVGGLELAQVVRGIDGIEQRGLGQIGHRGLIRLRRRRVERCDSGIGVQFQRSGPWRHADDQTEGDTRVTLSRMVRAGGHCDAKERPERSGRLSQAGEIQQFKR